MDQAITRAAGAAPRAVGEFQGFIDGEPSVVWTDRKNMPQVGDRLFAIPARAAVPRSWAVLLTSENHGTVGPVGCTFPWAGEKHERVQVVEIVEAGAAPAAGVDLAGLVRIDAADILPGSVGASTVLTDERIGELYEQATSYALEDDGYAGVRAFVRYIELEVAAQAGQVAVPDDYSAGLRVGLLEGAGTVRELYVNHVYHTGLAGMEERARKAEQVSLEKADEAFTSAPAAAPAAPAVAQLAEPFDEQLMFEHVERGSDLTRLDDGFDYANPCVQSAWEGWQARACFAAPAQAKPLPAGQPFDFHAHLARQAAWSETTFGPGSRTKGVCDHIRKELLEIEADPTDLREWIDVVILGLDGAWRCGGTPEQIIAGTVAKQTKNEGRTWPDWRTADPDKAIEHDRSKDGAQASTAGGRQEGRE